MVDNDELLFDLGEILANQAVQTLLEQCQGLKSLFEGIIQGDTKKSVELFEQAKPFIGDTELDAEAIKNKIQYIQIVSLADKHKKLDF